VEVNCPAEAKVKELGINLILGGHRETKVFGVRNLAARIRAQM
jgi:putative NIF3 family GTP cyclohydrolase 1 type 2